MDAASRISAALAYVPALGWLYVLIFRRRDKLAMFHVRQSIGLFLFLLAMIIGWAAFAWVAAWLPFGIIASSASFALVIAAYAVGAVSWVAGILHALRGQPLIMPIFGKRAANIKL